MILTAITDRAYGSGYPGITGRGVSGRGFPFYFWPLAWGGVAAVGTSAYLHIEEYGAPDNSSRPGGAMVVAEFLSSTAQSTSAAATALSIRLLADNATVTALIPNIIEACASSNLGNTGSVHIVNFTGSDGQTSGPKPEQTVQYYRASSVALTFDGYNNTAVFMAEGAVDVPLPEGLDLTLLNCLNSTIGLVVPLVNGGVDVNTPSIISLVGLMYVVWAILFLV